MKRLILFAMLALVLVAACAPAPTPAPTAAPPTAAPKPTEVPKPTEAPKPTEPPKPTAVPPTATPLKVETLRFVWFTDGPDQAAIEKLIKEFNAANPDIKVELAIVPFAELNTLLTTQAEAGKAPDLARVTEPPRFTKWLLDIKPYLKNKNFDKEFIPEAQVLVTGEKGEMYGYPHDFTLNAPFINMTLVKKAGLELPKGDKIAWKDWVDLAVKVKKATNVPYAFAVDRSGHRLDGFIQAMGGGFFTPDGKDVRINSPENLKAIGQFVAWHKDGTMPLEVWAGGGSGYADARQLFVNQQLVFYLSGNWQMAFFNQTIGDKFEWKAVPNACEVQCGGMPGGKFLVAFKTTPEKAEKQARLLEFLGSRKAMEQYAAESLFLPTRNDIIKEGMKWPMRNEDMNTFLKGIAVLPKSTYVDNYHPRFGPVANEVRDRVTQAITGELTVEKALENAQAKAKDLIK